MISFVLILIGLVLFYALFTNKTSDLLNALLNGTPPSGATSTTPKVPAVTLPTPVTG